MYLNEASTFGFSLRHPIQRQAAAPRLLDSSLACVYLFSTPLPSLTCYIVVRLKDHALQTSIDTYLVVCANWYLGQTLMPAEPPSPYVRNTTQSVLNPKLLQSCLAGSLYQASEMLIVLFANACLLHNRATGLSAIASVTVYVLPHQT